MSKMHSKMSAFVAILAGSALSSGVVLAAGNTGPRAPEPLSPVGTALGSASLWAVIKADGTIARSDGAKATTTGKTDTPVGSYKVGFYRNVRGCAYVATIGGNLNTGVPPTGQIVTEGRFDDVNGVFVQTSDSTGALADRPFHLLVTC